MKPLTSSLVLTAILAVPCAATTALADSSTAPAAQSQVRHTSTYLGIGIEDVPPALSSQLPGAVASGQGVLVVQVAPDSPASRAGLQPYDILLGYGDQKLFSPEQLTKLVRADQPGRQVDLQIVRNGQVSSIAVTLGEKAAPVAGRTPGPAYRHPHRYPHHIRPPLPQPFGQRQQQDFWESFYSLSLKKLEGERYQAVIEYLAKDGSKQHHEFQGTRREIRDQILQEKDLPAAERRHLLDALTTHNQLLPPDVWPPFDPQEFEHLWYGWPPAL